jgi:Na+-driven multidrug efflux pump
MGLWFQAWWQDREVAASSSAGSRSVLSTAAPTIIGWISSEAGVQRYGVACLRTVSCSFLFYAIGMVLTQAFNGAGDTWTPTLIHCFVFWALEIPAAWVLSSVLKLGPQGVFLAITLAFSTLAVVSAVLFRRRRWKLKEV